MKVLLTATATPTAKERIVSCRSIVKLRLFFHWCTLKEFMVQICNDYFRSEIPCLWYILYQYYGLFVRYYIQ